MALKTTHNEVEFGVGDVVRVHLKVNDRTQIFEGTVIKIKGEGKGKSFTVRRIGAQKIGIEQIFPLNAPTVEKVEVSRKGMRGSRHAKLYYIRDKSKKEIETIYSRARRREEAKTQKPKAVKKKKVVKKVAKKVTSKKSSK